MFDVIRRTTLQARLQSDTVQVLCFLAHYMRETFFAAVKICLLRGTPFSKCLLNAVSFVMFARK